MTGPYENPDSSLTHRENEPVPSLRAQLLRAAADGETTTQQAAAIKEHLRDNPEDASVIEFERQLRQSIASLGADSVSDQLRRRVRALAAAPPDAASSPVGRITPAGRGANRWFAIAASLAVIVAGGYVVVRTLQSGTQLQVPLALDDAYRASLVSFVSIHHEQCELHAEMAMRELKFTNLDEIPSEFAAVLGTTVDVGSPAISGFHFMGGGPCAVPGGGESVHMVFEADDATLAKRTPMISLFVQQDSGTIPIEQGRTYRVLVKSGTVTTDYPCEVYVWKKNGLVYFLASTSRSALSATLRAFNVDEPSQSI